MVKRRDHDKRKDPPDPKRRSALGPLLKQAQIRRDLDSRPIKYGIHKYNGKDFPKDDD